MNFFARKRLTKIVDMTMHVDVVAYLLFKYLSDLEIVIILGNFNAIGYLQVNYYQR